MASNFTFGFQDDGRLRDRQDFRALDQGRAIGGKALRLIISRDRLKRQGGGYDFSIYDNIVNQARARGIAPQVVLDNRSGGGMGNPGQYEQFVKAAAQHFKGRVGTYSLINEPDLKMAPDKYRQLFIRGQRALASKDQQARVLFGEFSPHHAVGYARAVLAKGGLTASGFAMHPYQSTDPLSANTNQGHWGIGRTGQIQSAVSHMNLRTRANKTPGLYYTEFGYDPRQTDKGAAYWPRALRKARKAGVREMIAYTMTGGGNGWDTGLLNPDGTPREAYNAIKASARYTR